MTDARKLKKRVRSRAERTGESYAAARRQVVAKLDAEREAKTRSTAEQARQAPATGAVSEERCREKTGHGFDHWFRVLDRFGARKEGHTKAARHLLEEHQVSAWYAQAITVAYERAHGLREVNQQCTGDFQTSVSRVLPVDVEAAQRLFVERAERDGWLLGLEGEPAASLQTALEKESFQAMKGGVRLRYRPAASLVELELRAKNGGRATVVVRHSKIGDRGEMESLRGGWRQVLDCYRAYCRES